MEQHVKAVGILHAIMAAIGLVTVLLITLVFGAFINFVAAASHQPLDAHAVRILTTFATLILALVLVCSLPGLLAGIGLLSYRGWARWVIVVISILHLAAFPVGTVVGGYSLWVLLNPDVARLFEGQNDLTRT